MRISDWSSDVCSSDLYAGSREILDATRQIEAEKILEQRFQKYVDLARATTPAGKWLDIGCGGGLLVELAQRAGYQGEAIELNADRRSEEHTSELQSLMRISYAVFCLKKKKTKRKITDRSDCT